MQKIIITEKQRGLLFKNGKFIKMLEAGKYWLMGGKLVDLLALGHNLGAWTETKTPTCIETGAERSDCSRCDYFETREIALAAHSYELSVTPPTCFDKGYTSHICSVCQDTFVDTYIDELGHQIVEWQETKAPTCLEKGSESGQCIRCDYSESRDVEALGHDMVSHAAKDPTATEDGWKEYETCTRCDHSTFEKIPALGTPEPNEPDEELDFVTTLIKGFFEFVLLIYKFLCGLLGIEI